jgi:hypothetical protein
MIARKSILTWKQRRKPKKCHSAGSATQQVVATAKSPSRFRLFSKWHPYHTYQRMECGITFVHIVNR